MDYKYVHEAFKKFSNYFKRSYMISGTDIKSTYSFASDLPYIANHVIIDYEHNVYDYACLLDVDVAENDNFVNAYLNEHHVSTCKLRELNIEQFDNIIRKNIAVAARMKELHETSKLLNDLLKL